MLHEDDIFISQQVVGYTNEALDLNIYRRYMYTSNINEIIPKRYLNIYNAHMSKMVGPTGKLF